MPEETSKQPNYISLNQAAQLTSYSSNYLRLRVGQNKLQAVKIGRDWFTTQEWLNDYLKTVAAHTNGKPQPQTKIILADTGDLGERGQPSFKTDEGSSRQESPRQEIGRVGENEQNNNGLAHFVKNIAKKDLLTMVLAIVFVFFSSFAVLGFPYYQNNLVNNLEKIQLPQTAEVVEQITRANVLASILDSFENAMENLTYKIYYEGIIPASQFITSPWRDEPIVEGVGLLPVEPELVQSPQPTVIKETIIKEVIKEVPVYVSQPQPTTIYTNTDVSLLARLANLENQIPELQSAVSQRLYAPGGVISQTIQMTQPVMAPRIYQENGDIVFQTAGSGSVYLTAATGIQISGQQIVLDAQDSENPSIYLQDPTIIKGATTINLPSGSSGNILALQLAGTDKFTVDADGVASLAGALTVAGAIDATGNITTTGNLTVSGSMTITGAQTYSGASDFTASSTSPALSVNQTGTGDIVYFKDFCTTVFAIANGGRVGVGTTTPVARLHIGTTTPSSATTLGYLYED